MPGGIPARNKPSRSHYRSYRASDDHYTSYSGEQRPCISPYLDARAAERAAQLPTDADSYAEASDTWPKDGDVPADEGTSYGDGAQLPPDHVQYCFNRYRSYRPEDNSYRMTLSSPYKYGSILQRENSRNSKGRKQP